jgi:Sulfotransferase domain
MPSFVVIGAQKSASTFLQDQLSLHPDVEIPDGEVRSFEDPFYAQGAVDELPSLFLRADPRVARGIKRPDYLGRPEIPARLAKHLPDARLLVVLREPIARAVSSYFHFVRHGFVPLVPIDEAFDSLLAGSWADRFPHSSEVLEFGRYGEQLTRYLEYFPPEALLVFEQHALIGDPQGSLRRAFEFIGVEPGFKLPERDRVSNRGVYSPLRLRLLRTKNRTRYRYTEDMRRRFPKRATPWGWTYNAAVVGLDRVVLSRFDDGRPPALSPAIRARLDDYYAPDLDVLRQLLTHWPVDVTWL